MTSQNLPETNSRYSEKDSRDAAKQARLRYVHDSDPGISRKKHGKVFSYTAPNGNKIFDDGVIERINSLAIPPAYQDVWICTLDNGHLQATGRDARGRKQYRYHPRWGEVRNANKFSQVLEFSAALPVIRKRIEEDMASRNLTRERVLATIIQLMDKSNIRIGNLQYAKENQSFGLTTLQKDHVTVSGETLKLEFKGKSGKMWNVKLRDRRIANTIKRCEDIEGQELFHYLDDDGNKHRVTSDDVNSYLHELTQRPFTAKDFRTWSATCKAVTLLSSWEYNETKKEIQAHLKQSIKAIAEELGHTPAICRKSYIHPNVIEHFSDGRLHVWSQKSKLNDIEKKAALFLKTFC